MAAAGSAETGDFSLVCGGPFYRLMLRMRLIRQDAPAVVKRAVLAWAITWLPLLLLSAIRGTAIGTRVDVPFLRDFAGYGRLVVALPLLILAEVWIDKRLVAVVREFTHSGFVETASQQEFATAVAEAGHLRNSVLAEALLLAGAYATVFIDPLPALPRGVSTWQAVASGSAWRLTAAGWWYAAVSIPLFLFLLYRWGWKFFIWAWFLRRVSRLRLRLVAIHPDHAAGLDFLGLGQIAFGPLIFAVAAAMAAAAANRLVFMGVSFSKLQAPLIGFVVLMVVVFLAPLLFFVIPLGRARVKGLLSYGALAAEYTQAFDHKWVGRNHPEGEQLLGSPDIQSLADMGNSFELVHKMRIVPFDLRIVLVLALAAAVPLLPLLLTVMPAVELVRDIWTLIGHFLGA